MLSRRRFGKGASRVPRGGPFWRAVPYTVDCYGSRSSGGAGCAVSPPPTLSMAQSPVSLDEAEPVGCVESMEPLGLLLGWKQTLSGAE